MSAPPAAAGSRKWQCKHCKIEIPALPLTFSFDFCPVCSQDVRENVEGMVMESSHPTSTAMEIPPDEIVSSGAIPKATGIKDADISPQPRTAVDSVDKAGSSATLLYPTLDEIDTSLGSVSLSDQSKSEEDKQPLPQKRQLEDSQAVQTPKKKCDSDDPCAPSPPAPETAPPQPSTPPPLLSGPPPLPHDPPPGYEDKWGGSPHGLQSSVQSTNPKQTNEASPSSHRNDAPEFRPQTDSQKNRDAHMSQSDEDESDDGFTVVVGRKKNRKKKKDNNRNEVSMYTYLLPPRTLQGGTCQYFVTPPETMSR